MVLPPRQDEYHWLVSGKQGFAAHGCRQTITLQNKACSVKRWRTYDARIDPITGGVKRILRTMCLTDESCRMLSVSTRTLWYGDAGAICIGN
jgi:hypothetical protein